MFEYVILNIHSIKNNNNCRKRRFEGKGSAGNLRIYLILLLFLNFSKKNPDLHTVCKN